MRKEKVIDIEPTGSTYHMVFICMACRGAEKMPASMVSSTIGNDLHLFRVLDSLSVARRWSSSCCRLRRVCKWQSSAMR